MATCTTHSWPPNLFSFWKNNPEKAEFYNNIFLQPQRQKIAFSVLFPWPRRGGNKHKPGHSLADLKQKVLICMWRRIFRSMKMINKIYEWIQLELIMDSTFGFCLGLSCGSVLCTRSYQKTFCHFSSAVRKDKAKKSV